MAIFNVTNNKSIPYTFSIYRERVDLDNGTIEDIIRAEADFNLMLGSELLYMTPTTRKLNKLYSMLPDDGLGDYTVATQSTKWVTDENGLLVEVTAGLPAFTYENGYAQLLKEGQSTNLIRYSSDFSEYSKTNLTINQNSILSPEGINNASTIDFNIVNSYGQLRRNSPAFSIASVYLKYISQKWVLINCSGLNGGRYINLQDMVVGDSTGISYDVDMVDAGNGWFRIVIKGTSAVGSTIDILASNDSGTSVSPINSTGSVGIYQVQTETGTAASSPILTNGATVTRLADDISVTTPAGVTQITETINGVDNVITTIPATHQISEGLIDKVKMI